MKFGPVPLSQAIGAILAHSVPLAHGRLRKGRLLEPADIEVLRAEGHHEVTVARLDIGDVPEDEAATRLAAALVPDRMLAGIKAGNAGTGRVNLISDVIGVAQIDARAIDAVNAIDPMITIATVPHWQRMERGGMVATVKIIAYAVSAGALEKACDAAQSAIRMRPTAAQSVDLIQTVVAGDDGEKGHRAIQSRLSALGLTMRPKQIVAHRVDAVSAALKSSDADVVLILTASATSDIADVAPSAVVAAGGTITHFGMPVDPGNLLFLGDIGEKPVIGLPGCARSPALNGADWVLERVVCGVPVTSADIAGMGVGGLLKEIPTRPQPRRKIDQSTP